LLGFATGVLGGAIQSKILSAPMVHSILLGGFFGLAFSLLFARRANTPGAGLIWGLGGALLLWFVIPAGLELLVLRSASSEAMLSDAQARFPELVAYLVCLGMPVGVVLGVREVLRGKRSQPQFRWGRAIVEVDLPEPSVDWHSAAGNTQGDTCRCFRGCRSSTLRPRR
jgi:hypothetical protein